MSMKKDIVIKTDGEKNIIIPKYKQKTMLDHFMILLGVVCAILVFIVIFDILYELSIFGYLFNRSEWLAGSLALTGQGQVFINGEWAILPKIYDDGLFLTGFWMPTLVFSIFFVLCAAGLLWLITYYIRDYVEVARGLVNAIKSLKSGVTSSVKDAFSDLDKKKNIIAKKTDVLSGGESSALSDYVEKPKKQRRALLDDEQPAQKKAKSPEPEIVEKRKDDVVVSGKSKEGVYFVEANDLSDSALDALLSGSKMTVVNKNADSKPEEYKPKSLFDK